MRKRNVFVLLIVGLFAGCNTPQKKETEESSAVTEPVKKEAPEGPIYGLDISHFQGNVSWDQVKKDGIRFAFAKATQGVNYSDPNYAQNVSSANDAGIPIGSYHFYMSMDDPERQADHFVSVVGEVADGDMPPVLDLEQGGIRASDDKQKFQADVLKWLDIVEKKLGMKPIIYTNNPFGNEYLTDSKFANYQLWVAEYTKAEKPNVPETWKDKGWLMWQRSQRGVYTGVPGQNVDHDVFNGTSEALQSLTKK
ncbi:MAG: GH25 family lysozyme [Bacteroidota bacterium]